jgi:hypothetical protein
MAFDPNKKLLETTMQYLAKLKMSRGLSWCGGGGGGGISGGDSSNSLLD